MGDARDGIILEDSWKAFKGGSKDEKEPAMGRSRRTGLQAQGMHLQTPCSARMKCVLGTETVGKVV